MTTYSGLARIPNTPDQIVEVIRDPDDLDNATISLEHHAAERGGFLVPGSVTASS